MNAQAWKEMDDVPRGLREAAKASSPTDAEEMCAEQMEFLNGMIDDFEGPLWHTRSLAATHCQVMARASTAQGFPP